MAINLTNQLCISGVVKKLAETRYSPAGIPHTYCWLEHRSRQIQAGLPRQANCTLPLLFSGNQWQPLLSDLSLGSQLEIIGYLAEESVSKGNRRLVVHCQQVSQLD
jgi:primosomal replication protein N